METNQKVSIVLPTYNGARYIRESLESILNQTYKNWELIIVNDCSTDETAVIIREYAAKDSRIRIIDNSVNQKLPRSLNIGFSTTMGKYLTWTSDDNIYLPDAIEKMQQFLMKNEFYMVCARMDYIDETGSIIGKCIPYDEYYMFLRDTVGACFMYKREVLNTIGEYNPSRVYIEDYDYWQRVLKKFGHIGFISDTLYLYRQHQESLTATKQKQVCWQRAQLNKDNFDLLLKLYCKDKNKLCHLYYDFIDAKYKDSMLVKILFKFLPEVKGEINELSDTKEYFIFGAGDYGTRAFKLLNGRAKAFIDNDKNKIGKLKEGIPIFSLKELLPLNPSYLIVIAIDNSKAYEIIRQLFSNGIRRYSRYQTLNNNEV